MRIIAVMGDYYHDVDLFKDTLDHVLKNLEDSTIEIKYVNRHDLVNHLTNKVNLVILASENRLNPAAEKVDTWMTENISKQITEYVSNGGAWLAWHSGMASYDNVPRYLNMLKGSLNHHPAQNEVTYKLVDEEVVTLEGPIFTFEDEHYFVTCETKETTIFLESISDKGKSIAGWYHTFEDGKVLCFTPAHKETGLTHQSTIQLLTHSITWLLDK